MREKILIRTAFSDWHPIDKVDALEYAKWKINAITTSKDYNEALKMVNDNFKGIEFSLDDLKS